MPERPFGPPEDPDRYDDWEECVADMTDEGYSQEEAERICGAWKDETENSTMTNSDEPEHRAYYQPSPSDITLREEIEGEEGVFVVRMPIASTGEVRNPGDDPLDESELRGMRDQINDRGVGVFLDHGGNRDVGDARYSAVGKLGEWQNADVVPPDRENGDDETLLVADARLMDPDTLPRIPTRGALGAIKSQIERDISISSSIGWGEDEEMRGGVDLMEASLVGIPADPRTTSTAGAAEMMARAALDTRDVDPETLVDEFRAVVMGPDATDEPETDDSRDMTDDDSPDDAETGSEPDETQASDDWRERMLDMQERQLELQQSTMESLNTIADAIREDDMDDDEEDDDDEEEDDEQSADVDETQSADDDADADGDTTETDADTETDERSIDVDGDEVTAEEIRAMREQLDDAAPETPETNTDRDADTDETSERDDPLAKYGLTGGH